MCSTFSVCSKRCSVIVMSMTSCNLLLVSFGVSSSTVRLHPMGVLSHGIALPVSFLCASARSGRKQTRCPCCGMGLTATKRSSHFCFSRFNGHWFAFCILGHKQTSTFIAHNRLASCRARYSRLRVSGSRDAVPALRLDSHRDLSALLV